MAVRESRRVVTDTCAQVLPHLYIGDKSSARNLSLLQSLGVMHILNCTLPKQLGGIPNYFENHEDTRFCYLRIPVTDSEGADIAQYFDTCIAFIEEALSKGYSALVHCQRGVSRSATIILAFLMKTQGKSLAQAYTHLRESRPSAKVNPNFLRQLKDYEMNLKSKNNNEQLTAISVKRKLRGPIGACLPRSETQTESDNGEEDEKDIPVAKRSRGDNVEEDEKDIPVAQRSRGDNVEEDEKDIPMAKRSRKESS